MSSRTLALAEAFGAAAPLKVWSVVVTVLGDMAQAAPEAELSGPVLTDLMGRIGVQPEATRVALHRLRQDGWILSRKQGRTGFVRLSAHGRAETERVAARVFGPAPVAPAVWTLAVTPPPGRALPGAIDLGRGIALYPGVPEAPELLAARTARPDLPDWARAIVWDLACSDAFEALERALAELGAAPLPDDCLDRMAWRLLVLHGWRRLILKSSVTAELALGATAPVARCRVLVQGLLAALPRPASGLAPRLRDDGAPPRAR